VGAWFGQVPVKKVQLILMWLKMRLFTITTYQFDRNFLVCSNVCTYEPGIY